MRLIPLSSAACENEVKLRDAPGRSSENVVNGILSDPKKTASTTAPAPLNVLCPDVYSGNGGVAKSGSHAASFSVASFPSVSPLRIAAMGRHKLYAYLQSHDTTAASDSAMFSSAKRRAFCSIDNPCCALTS